MICEWCGEEFVAKRKTSRACCPEHYSYAVRNAAMKEKYGITLQDFWSIKAEQDYVCVGCGANTNFHNVKLKECEFAVDHNHDTGQVRGLLCTKCNYTLGHANEDPERLRSLADYIEGHNMLQSKFDKWNKWALAADKHNIAKPQSILNVKNDVADLFIYDAIGADMFSSGISAKNVADSLKDAKGVKTLNIRINSPGGDVFDGLAIYNSLTQFKANKVVHIDGLAASIASVIAMAGDKIVMAAESEMMIHSAWTVAVGNSKQLKEMADRLDTSNGHIRSIYQRKTGMDEAKLTEMMDAETWMNSSQAASMKFADEVYTPDSKHSNVAEPASFPKNFIKVASPIELMRMRSKKG
jgi:ATP-dependent Clp protease protease subunit